MKACAPISLLAYALCLSAPLGVMAQSLVADYRFEDTLASSVGAPTHLEPIGEPGFQTESVDGMDHRVLTFDAGEGCRLPNASQVLGEAFTIVVLFRFESNSSWRRVLDFRNRKTDWGLYSYYGNLNFYNIQTGMGGAIQPEIYVQVALTRNQQQTVRGYVNGTPEIDFFDSHPEATLDDDNILSFFQDDLRVQNEHSAGAVSRIRIWDGALSPAAIAALDRAPGGAAISPPVISGDLNLEVVSGQPLDYTIAASNNPISFSATNLASWMNLSPSTGRLSGTAGSPGVYDIGISAFNAGGSDSRTLRVTVTPSAGATLGFAVGAIRSAEDAGTIEIRVLRQGDPAGQAQVGYATLDGGGDGGALAGEDYLPNSGTLTFESGETEQTIRIELINSLAREPDEEFFVELSGAVGASIAQPARLRIVIEDVPIAAPRLIIANAVVIKWMSLPDIHYRVLYTPDMESGNWMVLRDGIVGNGEELQVCDEVTTQRRFYSVEIIEESP